MSDECFIDTNPQEGFVEIISAEFVTGWTSLTPGECAVVYARLDGKIIGCAHADLKRSDLSLTTTEGHLKAAAFVIVFSAPVPADKIEDIQVFTPNSADSLPRAEPVRIDRAPSLQIFVFGSPRSGTSELANTIAAQLGLPWAGESHAGPLFAAAAKSLCGGDNASQSDAVRFMAEQNLRKLALEAAKRTYFYLHGSTSFIDKTPGVPMINAAPFLLECFPQAKMICLKRNGISNVLSRMAKFGGDFDEHCADWAEALNQWAFIRDILPHYLELNQEDMAAQPEKVGAEIADYLEMPHLAAALAESLRTGSLEKTGAGRGRYKLDQTGWSEPQILRFRQLCGPTMERFGYPLDPPYESDFF